MCMRNYFGSRCSDQHATSHSEVNNPLPLPIFIAGRQIKNNMLSYPAHLLNARAFQGSGDFCGRRFQRLRLAANPYRFYAVTADPLMESASNSLYFWEFRHALSLSQEAAAKPKGNTL